VGVEQRRPRRGRALGTAVVVLLGAALAGCLPIRPAPPPPLQISTNPALFPSFSADVIDYVSHCNDSTPAQVSVTAPTGTTVSVDAQPAKGGSFNTQVTRKAGQRFTIVARTASGSSTTYNVRCLDPNFPSWRYQRPGTPQADFYVTVACCGPNGASYPAIFDSNGVPIWWGPETSTPYAMVLPNGDVAWTKSASGFAPGTGGSGAEEHRLDGSLVRTIKPATGSSNGDLHELLQLPNGDYVMAAALLRSNIDLSSWVVNGHSAPANATIVDYVLQEITADQQSVVWSWDVNDHVPATETPQEWRVANPSPACGCFDPYHFNSIEAAGNNFVASFRNLDGIYRFDPSTGSVLWKLGGTARPESLTAQGDSVFTSGGSFSGQHDARVLADGTVTVHDNGTAPGRQPRAVRYSIDTTHATATLQNQLTDPLVPGSFCCGSARVLPGGDWVIGWGGNCCQPNPVTTATELTSGGSRVFLLQFDGANGSVGAQYRFLPVPSGLLTRDALRAGLDAEYP